MRFKLRFTIVNHLLRMFLLVLILLMTMIFALLWFFQIDVTARGRGSVTCGNWIDIKPEIEGIIEKMAVREGEWVREGKLLAEDSRNENYGRQAEEPVVLDAGEDSCRH